MFDYVEEFDKTVKWKKAYTLDDKMASTIDDESILKKLCYACPWCKTKLIVVDNRSDYELLTRLREKNPLTIKLDCLEKNQEHSLDEYNIWHEGVPRCNEYPFHLPIKCSEGLTTYKDKDSRQRIKAYCRIETSKSFIKTLKESNIYIWDGKSSLEYCPCCDEYMNANSFNILMNKKRI